MPATVAIAPQSDTRPLAGRPMRPAGSAPEIDLAELIGAFSRDLEQIENALRKLMAMRQPIS